MSKKRFILAIMLTLAVSLGSVSSAFAQSTADEAAANLYSTTTSGLTTAAVVGGIVLTVVLVMGADSDMESYMEQNAVAMQHDLYMGSGETARDLAEIFHVPETDYDRFAELLFAHRGELAPLAEPGQVDAASAQKFAEVVVDNMLQDEALASHIRALLG